MKKYFYFLLILLCSCNLQQKVLDDYVGKTKSEFILNEGPPEQVLSDGSDGQILVYSYVVPPMYIDATMHTQTVYKYVFVYVHPDGKIYHWLKKSSIVPPEQIEVYLR